MKNVKLTASGLHCKSCASLIHDVLEEKGAQNITVSFDEKTRTATIACDYDGKISDLSLAIEQEGYTVKG